EPEGILRFTPRLAWTGPKYFSIPRSSRAGSDATAIVAHIVMHLDAAGDDISLGLLDLCLHGRGDERAIILVIGPVHSAFLQAHHMMAGPEGPILRRRHGTVRHQAHTLDHRSQHGAGMQVILVGIHADGELAAIGGGL